MKADNSCGITRSLRSKKLTSKFGFMMGVMSIQKVSNSSTSNIYPMQIKNIFSILFFSTLFFRCEKKYEVTSPEKYFGSIADYKFADSSSYQKLSTVFPFEWDRMIVLQPYQHPFLKECGYEFDLPESRIENTEGLQEYLFIKDSQLIMHLIYNDNFKNNVLLVVDSSINALCGIENSPDLYIKFRSDSSYDFLGKSYTIFKK